MPSKQPSPRPKFSDLVESYAEEIYRYLRRILGNARDAEDSLQEAFLRAYRAYPSLTGEVNYRAWLYKIAGNTAKTDLGKRRRREDGWQRWAAPLLERQPSIAERVEARERLIEVLKAVEQLPEKQRLGLILRRYMEMEYEQVGAILNCSPESARANVYQAVKKLRAQFKEGTEEVG